MKQSERFALMHWLSDFPNDKTYAEIMEMMRDFNYTWTHEDISVWETVEDCTLEQVADFIDDTRKHFESVTDGLVNTMRDVVNLAIENRPDDGYASDFDIRLNRLQVMIQEWDDA
jgi:hypothetical protein